MLLATLRNPKQVVPATSNVPANTSPLGALSARQRRYTTTESTRRRGTGHCSGDAADVAKKPRDRAHFTGRLYVGADRAAGTMDARILQILDPWLQRSGIASRTSSRRR
jgi:hypothetical protein